MHLSPLCLLVFSSCLKHELQLWRALQVGPWFHCMFSILFVRCLFVCLLVSAFAVSHIASDPSQLSSIESLLINHTFPNP